MTISYSRVAKKKHLEWKWAITQQLGRYSLINWHQPWKIILFALNSRYFTSKVGNGILFRFYFRNDIFINMRSLLKSYVKDVVDVDVLVPGNKSFSIFLWHMRKCAFELDRYLVTTVKKLFERWIICQTLKIPFLSYVAKIS